MKRATIKTRIYLGVFVLITGVGAALCLMIAGDDISFFRNSISFVARFSNTAGLVVGAPVRMGGVEIGRVEQISIENTGSMPAIMARLRIDSPYFEMIQSDASVSLDTQGVLGDKFVALNAGRAKTPLNANETIATVEGQGLTQVMEKSGDIMDSVASATHKLDAFASGLPEAASLNKITQDLTQASQIMRQIFTRLNSNDNLIAALQDPQAITTLRDGLTSLKTTAQHLESVAKKIDHGQGTLGALINDRALYEDLRTMLGHTDRGGIARRVFRAAGSPHALPPAQANHQQESGSDK